MRTNQRQARRTTNHSIPKRMMLPKIIFFTAVSAATVAVILLALFSPSAYNKSHKNHSRPWLALSLYIQPPHLPKPHPQTSYSVNSALVFHHTLTEGPTNKSRVIGKVEGFIIPIEHFAQSAFNIIYLTFDTPEYSGSLCVEGKQMRHGSREELTVVGGTGSFAFARGHAAFAQSERHPSGDNAMYHVKLRLRFPSKTQTIPG